MKKLRNYILLNAGTKTKEAWVSGLHGAPHASYHTKHMVLHISESGTPLFIHNNSPIDFSDAYVFTRLRGTDQQFCGILYDYFAHEGIPATDPIHHSYNNSAEKISQMLKLALAKIPIPETFIFREESFSLNKSYITERLTFPLIYKTDGSKGMNVHYINDQSELDTQIAGKRPHILGLIQPYIENTFDTRTIVAFGKVLGSIKRTRASGFLNNIAQGAVPSAYTITSFEAEMAIKASRVCGIDIGGVDMIHTPQGPYILEVNKSPQVTGFESVHPFKVFTKIAEIIRSLH